MIAVDSNVLVHSHRQDSPFHYAASKTVGDLAAGPGVWAIPWPCVHEFLAIVTHSRIYRTPTPIDKACDQVDAWMESPTLQILAEDREAHWTTLRAVVTAGQVTGAMVHDARIAAICLAHGTSVLLSADRDFSRFPSLLVRNPLI